MSSSNFKTRFPSDLFALVKALDLSTVIIWLIGLVAFGYVLSLSRGSCLHGTEWCGQDMDQYSDYSNSQMSGHGFSAKVVATMYNIDTKRHSDYIPEILRLPGYSTLLTLGRFILDKPLLALIYNFIFFVMILVYSVLVLKHFASKWITPLAFVFIAFNSSLFFYTGWLGNVDTMVSACLMAFFYHFLQISSAKRPVGHVLMAAIMGTLTVMSRQNTLIFILPFSVFYMALAFYQKVEFKRIIFLGLVLGIALLSLGLWAVRNYTIIGKFSLSEASGGQLFVEYTYFTPFPSDESIRLTRWFFTDRGGQAFMDEQIAVGKTIPVAYSALNQHLSNIAWEYIKTHPENVKKHYPRAVYLFYTAVPFGWPHEDFLGKLVKIQPVINSVLLYISLAFPLVLIFRPKKNTLLMFSIWFSVLLFTLISAFFHGVVIGNRGFLPVQPLTIVLVAFFFEAVSFRMTAWWKYIAKR